MAVFKNWLAKFLTSKQSAIESRYTSSSTSVDLSHFTHGNGQYLFQDSSRGEIEPECQYFPFWAASCLGLKPPYPAQTSSKHFPYQGFLTVFLLYTWRWSWEREPVSLTVQHLVLLCYLYIFAMMFSIVNNRMPVSFYRRMICKCCAPC